MSDSPSRRRVALIPSSYHPHFGGVEEHTRHVAKGLSERGHTVEVWTVDRGEHLGGQEVDGLLVRYLQTPLPAKKVPNLFGFLARGPRALARWVAAVRRFDPDVLHVHCFGPNGLYAYAIAMLLRKPLVISAHGETFMDESDVFTHSALLRRGLQQACRRAAAVTGCSTLVVEDLQSRFGIAGVQVVPNGVEAKEGTKVGVAPSTSGQPQVVAVGRLVHVKGFDLLLRALAASSRGARLTMVGEGPDQLALETLAAELGIADRVEFVGRRTAEEAQAIMSAGGVVVMPSRREAFGIVALEAWASGTPLIATSLGGPRGFVTHGVDGLLVNPEDTPALAAAIDRVLGDPDLASSLSGAGIRSVRQFTWDRVVTDYERIYDSVLSED